MLNLLWLLLPIAAAGGWFAARRSEANRPEAFWDYSANFHKGLNVLLNERQELPGELFDKLSDTDRDTADTHLALGNLFRRRGDMERAILMHESLLDKDELGTEVKAAAMFELSRDYDSAGLLDRSEVVLRDLIATGERLPDAYNSLLQLNERERDWAGAIEVAEEIEKATGEKKHSLIAHYYCELAHKASAEGYVDEAATMLDKALSHDNTSARAHMMLADIAASGTPPGSANTQGLSEALHHYAQVEKQRPELMPEIIGQRFEVLERMGDEKQLREFIEHIRERRNAYSVVRTTRTVIAKLYGSDAADRFFKDQVLQRPSLKGLRDWAHDQVELSKPGERDKVQVICSMLDKVIEDKPGYLCSSCGFRGNMLHWRCPGCGKWDTVTTIIGVEGE